MQTHLKMLPDILQNVVALDLLKKERKYYEQKQLFLDVGAGECYIEPFLSQNIIYHSLDIKPTYKRKHDYILNLDDNKIPVPDNHFDIIFALEVLEHTLRPQNVIDELKRIGKKDAIFVFSIPNEYNFLMRLYYLFGIKRGTETPWRVVEDHLHIQKPRVKDIKNLFKKNFQVLNVDYSWVSRMSSKSKLFVKLDRIINKFAKIYPNLFARSVVVSCKLN